MHIVHYVFILHLLYFNQTVFGHVKSRINKFRQSIDIIARVVICELQCTKGFFMCKEEIKFSILVRGASEN